MGPRHEFESVKSSKDEWPKFDGVAKSTIGRDVEVVEPPVLDDLELLFERDAGWTQDILAVNCELRWECKLLRGDLPELKLPVPKDILGLVKSGREVIANSKSLADEVLKLQETVTSEQAAWKVVGEEMA